MSFVTRGSATCLVMALTILGLCCEPTAACTRILYETGTGTYITGRSMDWSDLDAQTDLWVFPKGMKRDGGVGEGSIKWTSKYGSVVVSFYDSLSSDGANEAGLAGNVQYLAEANYGDAADRGKPTISTGAWLQYFLDNYGTVAETVKAMRSDPFTVILANLPNGAPALGHVSISDATGDSAIFQYVDGKLHIHHSREYTVMTNSPVYEQQLAINTYWELIGGERMLPGTPGAADRFVRASYTLKATKKFKDRRAAVASVFSQIRAVGVPFGMTHPELPNISSTLWRTVFDHDANRYYFDSAINPSVVWVDLDKISFKADAKPMKLRLGIADDDLAGNVASKLKPAKPFKFLAP